MRNLALVLAIMLTFSGSLWCTALNTRAPHMAREIGQDSQPSSSPSKADTATRSESGQVPSTHPDSTFERHMQEREAGKPGPGVASPPPPTMAAPSPYSLQLNLDITTAYFYHGIIQEDTGLILQPAARLTVNLFENDDFKIDAILGTWNSFHSQKTGAQASGDFTDYWYECDLTAGVALTMDQFVLTTTYTFLTSPSDAYQTVQELDVTLAFDDSELLGACALHPYVLLGIETGADASDGADSDTGTYLELGVAPGFSFDLGATPVAISFPCSIGLSVHDYYQNAAGDDETFGFAQIGAKASVPLPLGEHYGKWTLNAGIAALFLGDHTADFNGGDDMEFIGTMGLQVNF
jgi:hypothetical protein